MLKEDIENLLMGILRDDFSVRRSISPKSLICFEVGICDGDFQDFMALAEERCHLNLPTPCHLPFREEDATVEIISEWIVQQGVQ
jgi:hypothetical protein